jgi:hypothetical protein
LNVKLVGASRNQKVKLVTYGYEPPVTYVGKANKKYLCTNNVQLQQRAENTGNAASQTYLEEFVLHKLGLVQQSSRLMG